MTRLTPRTSMQRWLIRAGLLWCTLLVAAAGISLRWGVRLIDGQKAYAAQISCGAISAYWTSQTPQRGLAGQFWKGACDTWRPFKSWRDVAFYWSVYAIRPRFDSSSSIAGSVSVPLWLPLLVVAVPTYRLWRRTSRFPRGFCAHCGYNLTGNTSGVCPECGTRV